jgi:hypothetical protein
VQPLVLGVPSWMAYFVGLSALQTAGMVLLLRREGAVRGGLPFGKRAAPEGAVEGRREEADPLAAHRRRAVKCRSTGRTRGGGGGA